MFLSIYFPNQWWDIGILVLLLFTLPYLIKKILWSGNKRVDIDAIILFIGLLLLVGAWLAVAKGWPWFWNTTGWWGVGVLAGIALLIIFRKTITGVSVPKTFWKWFWSLLAIAGLTVGGYFVYHKLKDARFGKDIEKYETVKEDIWFKAKKGIPFKKEVLNFEGERWPIVKGRDTVTLTFDPPRGSKWVYKIWNRPDGSVGYKEIKKIPDIVLAGTYLYTTDKDCEIMISTKKPKL